MPDNAEDAMRIWDIGASAVGRGLGKAIIPKQYLDGAFADVTEAQLDSLVAASEIAGDMVAAAGITPIGDEQARIWNNACDGSKAQINNLTMAGIGGTTAKEQLNQRLYQVGYQLQQLEEIRRCMADTGMKQVEILINQAIEELANAWMHDRRAYRNLV